MKAIKVHRWLVCAAVWCAALLSACGGDGGTTDTTPTVQPAVVGSVGGTILASADNTPVAGADVSVGGVTVQTAADGSYTASNVPVTDRTVLRVHANGFVDALVPVAVLANQTSQAPARLLKAAAAVSFEAGSAAVIAPVGSTAQVVLAANSLVNANTGVAASGTLSARVTAIDPALDPATMPGDFSVSDSAQLESFGAVHVQLQDASGAALNLKPGATATIRVPLSSRAANAPATIPLYYFNETTGRWVAEGSATLVVNGANAYYEGTVSHFSTWNCDRPLETIYVDGCVNDAAGKPIAGVSVKAEGLDYSGSASRLSSATGGFHLPIMRGGKATLSARWVNNSNTVVVGPSQVDFKVDACLVIDAQTVAPSIVSINTAKIVLGLDLITLSVVASGSDPFTYQWLHDGQAMPGETRARLVVGAMLVGSGDYAVTVSNPKGSVTSATVNVLALAAQPLAPSFMTQPGSMTVNVGDTATFWVLANGTAPLSYQWQRDGTDIAGAVAATYTTPATVLADDLSTYQVRVGNAQGSLTSASATLRVSNPNLAAPTFVLQPADVTAMAGATATFSVAATGSPAPSLQWLRNGVAISGANAAAYTTPMLAAADSGAVYSVVATNSQGSVTSRGASLTISTLAADQKTALTRLMMLNLEFLSADVAGLVLSTDGTTFLAPASVCRTGSISATLNGGELPAAGTALPLAGTLAATASACDVDGTSTHWGSNSIDFNFSSQTPPVGSFSMTLNQARVRRMGSNQVDSDVTANGSLTGVVTGSVAGLDTTQQGTYTLGAGATLYNALNGLTATFQSGSFSSGSVTRNNGNVPRTSTLAMNNLAFTVAGVSYLATGSLTFDNTGGFAGSGQLVLSSNGARVGRIFFDANGQMQIEVDGTVQPFRAPAGVNAR